MASVIVIADARAPFDASQWICAGKIYKDVPPEVSDACSAARKMPSALVATFPSPDLTVTDFEFLALKLPEISEGLEKHRKTDVWFGTDLPNCDPLTVFWSLKSIPPEFILRELENDFPQKWLNGAKSILNPLDPSRRLPLFALPFFRKIHDLQDAQDRWAGSVQWARDEVPGCNLEIFASISWNTVHTGAPDGQLDWTRLVDDEWLSGEIIDNMMADIQSTHEVARRRGGEGGQEVVLTGLDLIAGVIKFLWV
ncbi:hypothetical protein FB451DRAFT_1445185 [Mycena latifolia]|nr:hypothetical protein FB451DRAFT_1445185 [Mycena latifolia]